jgi:hypothetical protein
MPQIIEVKPVNKVKKEVTSKAKDIMSIEVMGIKLFEKKDPVYESKILGIPAKFIGIGMILYKFLKR